MPSPQTQEEATGRSGEVVAGSGAANLVSLGAGARKRLPAVFPPLRTRSASVHGERVRPWHAGMSPITSKDGS